MLRMTTLAASLGLALLLAMNPAQASPLVAGVIAQQLATVNINTADAEQLAQGLTGVGLKRAQDIIKLRDELGQFTDIHQLMQVKGIGPRVIELNKERIVL
ncbi:competence protein ComEA [Pseudidiomarina indica]|uniref:Competence protein ComEA n=1 Tax=Pseudidiomarina indica TaxID=1159017 RepID=A0A1G6A1J0_9GAMM|nr:helix-hairpin-helix domain-containing protein [Pseudidiomarina indica]SDB02292.1 competence protein ComEA [Pseudidiomarina indica]